MKQTIVLGLAAAALVFGMQTSAAALEQTVVSAKTYTSVDGGEPFLSARGELIYYSTRTDFNMRACKDAPLWQGEQATITLTDKTTGVQLVKLIDSTWDGNCVYQWVQGKVPGHVYAITVDDGWGSIQTETFTAAF